MNLQKIKTFAITSALILAFALPLTTLTTTAADAEPWYKVNWLGRGVGVEIRSRAHEEGRVKCVVPTGEVLHRNHEQNWSRYIYVEWKRWGGREWEFKDVNGRWCPHWNRHGWVDKRKLYSIEKPSWGLGSL